MVIFNIKKRNKFTGMSKLMNKKACVTLNSNGKEARISRKSIEHYIRKRNLLIKN